MIVVAPEAPHRPDPRHLRPRHPLGVPRSGCPPSAPLAPDERLVLYPRFPLSYQPALRPSRLKVSALAAAAATIAGVACAAASAAPASAAATTLDAAAPVPGGASSAVLAGSHFSGGILGLAPAARQAPAQPAAVSPAEAAKPPAPKAPPGQPAAKSAKAATVTAPKAARTAAAARPAHTAARPAARTSSGSPLANVLKGVRHQAAAVQRPFTFYDSVTPQQIPAHQRVATYATGSFAVPASRLAGRGSVLWIDTQGNDYRASVLDVEPGDATPSIAANWAWHKLHADPGSLACIYTMRSEWPATQAAISSLPAQMRSHIRWWIADPTGYAHIVPGANATQWYWGKSYDISSSNSNL